MEVLKQKRGPMRATFTRTANSLVEALKSSEPDNDGIAALVAQLEEKQAKLKDADEEILTLMAQDPETHTSEDYEKEYFAVEEYNDRFTFLKTKAHRLLKKIDEKRDSVAEEKLVSKRNYKLPKIELKRFSGDVKEWLGFWSQFKKINDDEEIDAEDKFQYLIQATVEGSKARDIVQSFPPTAENYPLAIEHLKNRFGKDHILVEVYVRELLRLVLHNAMNPTQKAPLFKLYDEIETHLRALESLGVTTDNYAAMLYPLVEACLPEEVLKTWERNMTLTVSEKSDKTNKLDSLMKFLRAEVEGEERLTLVRQGFGLEQQRRKTSTKLASGKSTPGKVPTAAALYNKSQKHDNPREGSPCIFCGKSHRVQECQLAEKMSLDEKKSIVLKHGNCFTCLKTGHISRACKSHVRCQKCSKRHLAIMCPGQKEQNISDLPDPGGKIMSTEHSLANKSCTQEVLMQTLTVRFRGEGKDLIARALLDSGSQRSYLTKKAAIALGYVSLGEEKISHSLFGGIEAAHTHQRYKVRLSSLQGNYHCNFDVYDQEKICADVPKIKEGPWTEEVKSLGIFLSDSENVDTSNREDTSEIQLLIGADVAGKLFTGNTKLLDCGLTAIETHLGWTLMGKTPNKTTKDSSLLVLSLHVKEAKISDLWTLDSLGILDPAEKKAKSDLQLQAYEHFRSTVKRDLDGRYEVCLPWIEGHPPLPSNKSVAERRLKSTVRKLQSSGNLESYEAVLLDWVQEGVIERVPENELDDFGHYLPHRAVIRPSSTTKIRPVFDGSAKEKGFPSINDCLEKGPNLIETIPSVLNRFRSGNIGVISDIRKAFLQIGLSEKDRDFLRFLWWEKGNPDCVTVYRHRRVVFGISSSPFLLGATLAHLLENVPAHLQETAEKLKESWYVDNCVTSVDDEKELHKFISESIEIMSLAKFDLRGWTYTHPPVSPKEPYREGEEATSELEIKEPSVVPVLGLQWDLKTDTLVCDLRELNSASDELVTKRYILSTAHKIFDPIGFTAPFTLIPKLLLQECWKLKNTWDEELPEDVRRKFEKWKNQLDTLAAVRIPRKIKEINYNDGNMSLHVFCDASKYAYATCIFLRIDDESKVSCQLIQAKARVAPLKEVSIPRLELLACCIGARLADSVKHDLHFEHLSTFYWSDSTNALHWIKNEESWGVFVLNRVSEIRSLSNRDDWYNVPGQQNPADLPSRGCSAEVLLRSRWWEGPPWLRMPQEYWPKCEIFPNPEIINAEKRKTVISASNHVSENGNLFENISSFYRILRVISWIFRFYNKVKDRTRKTENAESVIEPTELTLDEIVKAERILMKNVQSESFSEDDKRLKSLHTFTDSEGLIRVKTRISMRDDFESFRYPIVLPSDHPVVTKLIRWKHAQLGHCGVQTLMVTLRETYWILKGRKTIRKVIHQCIRCKRYSAHQAEVQVAPLPEDRVRDAAVFEVTGVDLAGPLFLKNSQKAWIVLFTCAIYRAVHLELVTSLTTENFLQALRRFIARRGRPAVIYSDNGSNFVGANLAFKKINWKTVLDESNVKRITWKFIPPSAPWWGGWWERLISLVKQMLRKVLGRASLHYEELSTILCDCESVINARPLTYVSEDPEDLQPLTPAMFLQEIGESKVPDLDQLDSTPLRKRYLYRKKLRDDLRKRFRTEYLGQLRQNSKRIRKIRNISVGDMVIVGSENMKRLDWPLAKVTEIYPGKDGLVRVVKVKTKSGEQLRPIQRLYPLELCSQAGHQLRNQLNSGDKNTEGPSTPHQVTTRSGRRVKVPAI